MRPPQQRSKLKPLRHHFCATMSERAAPTRTRFAHTVSAPLRATMEVVVNQNPT